MSAAFKALVCDDDVTFRTIVRKVLEERGLEVVEACDGQEATNLFLKEEFDLVITDFLMPKIDGLQVVRNVKLSASRGENVPVILMSAISKVHIEQELAGVAPDYYLNKPFKPRKLAKILDKVLRELSDRERQGRQ